MGRKSASIIFCLNFIQETKVDGNAKFSHSSRNYNAYFDSIFRMERSKIESRTINETGELLT